ncbi:MAG: glutamate--tRNA ligase [Ardenticatenaceae bacterium]|nr:glutamate--tRNA ligase [Ardenticatenaceae bacterium]
MFGLPITDYRTMIPRFRFAPSPTGIPHIGNLHTALFSWALSRALRGDFIIRVEDSDPARYTPEAAQHMLEALEWLGLDWDEGPDIGGEYGPYLQSQRLPYHQQAIAQLVAGNHAYYGDDPAQPASTTGNPLRLRMPRTGQTVLHDAIRGDIVFENGRYEDPILVRSDGYPLYHLAAMVDDHDMGITHVVRGDDWIATSPIHIQLYKALGWQEPIWIHLPLILNKRGEKLKKRDPEGGYQITDFQAAGYLPAAVFNYLLLLGWSPDGEQEIIDKWQMRQQFRLERLSASPSVFDWDKLNWVNRQYIDRLSNRELAEQIRPFLEEAYDMIPAAGDWLVRLTAVLRPSLTKLEDAIPQAEWAFDDAFAITDTAQAALESEPAHPVLARLLAEITAVVLLDEQTAQSILNGLRGSFQTSHNWTAKQVFHPIRAALTGRSGGPPLHQVMALIGKGQMMTRISRVLRQ